MATKKGAEHIPADRLASYERLVSTQPEIDRKGATVPYTSHNGNMFSFLSANGELALRLSKDDREAFMRHYDVSLAVAYGAVMKEYVAVPDALLPETAELEKYFAQSWAYVQTLKPKPSAKKPAARKATAKKKEA